MWAFVSEYVSHSCLLPHMNVKYLLFQTFVTVRGRKIKRGVAWVSLGPIVILSCIHVFKHVRELPSER